MSKDKQLIIICLLTSIVIQGGIPRVSAMAPDARVRIEPADLVVGLNEVFVVQVVIEEADDLGAFQFNLIYDPSIVQVTEAALGALLESTGNSAVAVGPEVNNAEGRMAFGAVSLGGAAGPSGMGVLATITCIAQGEGSTVLGLQEVRVLDTAANAQWVTVESGQVVVRGAEALLPSPMPSVSIAPTETRPTEVTTPLAVPTVEATQAPAAMTTAPTSPPPSPSPAPIPSPTPLATIPVPAAASPSGRAVLGLMLGILAVAILAVFILSRRSGG